MAKNETKSESSPKPMPTEKPRCGLVMPISAIDGCTEQHWLEVKLILSDAIDAAGFTAQLVSAADDAGIIQKRIIDNLYDNPIVVCDVSGKNPNVMFELGLRLAFDKPTIIVKDDKTTYSFDTSPIEHVGYPRDLRFGSIVAFKSSLAEKVKVTHDKATKDPNYTTFLKHFGRFTIAKLDTKEVSKDDYIIEQIKVLREEVRNVQVGRKDIWDSGRLKSTVYATAMGFFNELGPEQMRSMTIDELARLIYNRLEDTFGKRVDSNIIASIVRNESFPVRLKDHPLPGIQPIVEPGNLE